MKAVSEHPVSKDTLDSIEENGFEHMVFHEDDLIYFGNMPLAIAI